MKDRIKEFLEKRRWWLLTVLLALAVVAVVAVGIWFWAPTFDPNAQQPNLEIVGLPSSSYYQEKDDSYSLNFVLRYANGAVKEVESNQPICQNKDWADLIKFVKKDSKWTYSVDKSVNDRLADGEFADIEFKATTVGGAELTLSVKVTRTPSKHLTMIFQDGHANVTIPMPVGQSFQHSVGDWNLQHEDNKVQIEGLVLAEGTGFKFRGWYFVDSENRPTNEKFDVTDNFYFDTDKTVVARYQADITLNSDGLGENRMVEGVYYNEKLEDKQLKKFNEELSALSDFEGWEFESWWSLPGGEGDKPFDVDKKYNLITTELFAKWTKKVKFNVLSITPEGSHYEDFTTRTVTYKAKLDDTSKKFLSTIETQYENQGKHVGWFSEGYGLGTIFDLDDNFTDKETSEFYNCVSFPIKLDYQNGSSEGKTIWQIYGQTLAKTNEIFQENEILSDENSLPGEGDLEDYNKWEFTGRWTFVSGAGSNEQDKDNPEVNYLTDQVYANKVSSGKLMLYAQRKSVFTLCNEISGSGVALNTPQVETIDIIYNSQTTFGTPKGGNWMFGGWYVINETNEPFDPSTLSNEPFDTSTPYNHNNNHNGKGNLTLRARWTSYVKFMVPDIVPTNKSIGTEGILKKVPVTYNAKLAEDDCTALAADRIQYGAQGKHVGWYTGTNGSGTMLNLSAPYNGTANAVYYNCVEFPIELHWQNGEGDAEKVTTLWQIFGQSLVETNKILESEENENVLPLDLGDLKYYNGWEFTGRWTFVSGAGSNEQDNNNPEVYYLTDQVYANKVSSGSLQLYAQRKSTFLLYNEIDSDGSVIENPEASKEEIVIIYKSQNTLGSPKKDGVDGDFGGWDFGDWYEFDGNCGNAFDASDSKKYISKTHTSANLNLRAKWMGTISFEVPKAAGASESLGSPQMAELPVIYGGSIGQLPGIDYTFPEGLSTVDWKTGKFGAGESINSFIKNGCYFGAAKPTFYNCTKVTITFLDNLTGENTPNKVTREVTYGTTFAGGFPRFASPDSDSKRTRGWVQESKWQVDELGEQAESFISDFTYNLNKAVSCHAIWNVLIQYNADIGNIENVYAESAQLQTFRYGEILALDNPSQQGSWTFAGWYSDSDYTGNPVERQLTNSEAFVKLVSDKSISGSGRYYVPLYAKWKIDSVALQYGCEISGNNDLKEHISVVYGQNADLPSTDSLPRQSHRNPIGWYNSPDGEEGELVSGNMYPLRMSTLYMHWEGTTPFTVSLHQNYDDVGVTATVKVKIGDSMPTITKPVRESYKFVGYFSEKEGGKPYYLLDQDGNLVSASNWDIEADTTLYAHWTQRYNVSYYDYNGKCLYTYNSDIVKGSPIASYPNKGRTPQKPFTAEYYYMFNGKWVLKNPNAVDSANTIQDDVVYYVTDNSFNATAQKYSIIEGEHDKAEVYNVVGSGQYGTEVKFELKFIGNGNTSLSATVCDSAGKPITVYDKNGKEVTFNGAGPHKFIMPAQSVKIKPYAKYDACLSRGTLITLADGSQKPVEELTGSEMLLVWNLYTGTFDAAPILFIDYDAPSAVDDIKLHFSDGTILEFVGGHGIWDVKLNEYVYIVGDNAQSFIGHTFCKQQQDEYGNQINLEVTLVDVVVEEKIIEAWCPVTASHFSYYTNGILTIPVNDVFEGFINIFDVDPETMKVDEAKMAADIEKYGLFTYDDFAEYIPEEVFYAFNGQYLKVAMGKGLLTWDDIYALIDRYQDFWTPEN